MRAPRVPRTLRLRGVQMHIGSQLTEARPFEDAVRKLLPLVKRLKAAHGLEFFSIGGGLGIVYNPLLASGPSVWWQSARAKEILTPDRYAAKLVLLLACRSACVDSSSSRAGSSPAMRASLSPASNT